MRILSILFVLIGLCSSIKAQTPAQFPYQAIIRNIDGALVTELPIALRFRILQGTINGTMVFEEIINTTTSDIGIANVQIGTNGALSAVDWTAGPYFIETAMDVDGGSNFSIMGTIQLLSVPYTLHSETAEKTVAKTKAARDNIMTPTIGQLVYCSDCGTDGELQVFNGSAWTNLLGGTPAP